MKIGIKRVARTIALVLALCATGGAWADPQVLDSSNSLLAFWPQFSTETLSSGSYSISNFRDGILSDGVLTIESDSSARGLAFTNDNTWASTDGITVMLNYSGFSLPGKDSYRVLLTTSLSGVSDSAIGVYSGEGGKTRGFWCVDNNNSYNKGYEWDSDIKSVKTRTDILASGTTFFQWAYASTATDVRGIHAYNINDYGTESAIYECGDLWGSTCSPGKKVIIGSSYHDVNNPYSWYAANNMQVHSVAIFKKTLSENERAAFAKTRKLELTADTTFSSLTSTSFKDLFGNAKDWNVGTNLCINVPSTAANEVTLTLPEGGLDAGSLLHIQVAEGKLLTLSGTAKASNIIVTGNGVVYVPDGSSLTGDVKGDGAVTTALPVWKGQWYGSVAANDNVAIYVKGETTFTPGDVAAFGTVELRGAGTLSLGGAITATSVSVPAGVTLVANASTLTAPVTLSAETAKLRIGATGDLPGNVSGSGCLEIADSVTATMPTSLTLSHTGGTRIGANATLRLDNNIKLGSSKIYGGTTAKLLFENINNRNDMNYTNLGNWGLKTADNWQGTVEFKNSTCGLGDPKNWGNASSAICFNNVSSYLYAAQSTYKGVLEIASGGWNIQGNYSGPITFEMQNATWKGTGTLTISIFKANHDATILLPSNMSTFQGGVAFSDGARARVTFGSTTKAFTAKSIIVESGASVTVSDGKTWAAAGGVIVDGNMTLGGSTSTISGTVTGSGKIIYPAGGVFPSVTGLNAAGWTGTVEIPSFTATAKTTIYFNNLGNSASKVVLDGTAYSYANPTEVGEAGTTINPTVEIAGTVYLMNGSQSTPTIFPCVTGSGNLYFDSKWTGTSYKWQINELKSFSGEIGSTYSSGESIDTALSIGTIALTAGTSKSIGDKLVAVDSHDGWDNIKSVDSIAVTIGGEATGYKVEKKSGGLYVAAVASATPTGGVATEYATLSAAKTALGSNAGTITLLMPSAESISLANGQVLNTNGKSYTGTVTPTGDHIEVASDSGTYMAVDNSSNTWQGSSGGAWESAENWEKGVVPNTYTAVTLPDNGEYTIGVTSSDKCGSITVNGKVTLNRGTSGWQQLHINGNISGSGTLTLNMVGLRADSGNGITVSCDFVGDGGTENAFVGGKPFTFENPVVIKGSSGSFFKNESVVITFNDSVEIQENAKLNANGANIVFCNSDIRLPSGGYLQPTSGAMTITEDAVTWPTTVNIGGFIVDSSNGLADTFLVEDTEMVSTDNLKVGNGGTATLTIGDGGTVKVGSSASQKWLTFLTTSGNSDGNEININAGGVLEACVITFDNNSSPCPTAIKFNGGALKAYVGTSDTYQQNKLIQSSGITVKVLSGGAVFDVVASKTANVVPVIATGVAEGTDGGLTKIGDGSLVVEATPTYNGKTKVVAGALYLPSEYIPNLDITTKEADSDKDGYKKYVFDPAAIFDGVSYGSVSEAVAAAAVAGGGTITLLRDWAEDITLVNGVYFNDGGFSYTGAINAPAAVAWNDGTVTYYASLDAANGAANAGAAQHKYVAILQDTSFTPSTYIKYLVADGVIATLVPYSPEYGMPVVATTDGTTGAVTYNLFASNNPTTYTWTGSGSHKYWSLSGNWEYGEGSAARRKPQAGDSAVINTGATITIGSNESVSNITIGAASPVTFTATSEKTLTVSEDIVLHNASASLVVSNNVTIADIGSKIRTDVADKCVVWVEDGSSTTYSVADPVAQIGDVKYGSLANALENASDTATITILANMGSVGVGIGQKVVVASGVTVGTISWGAEYAVQTNVTGDGTTAFAATPTATTYYWSSTATSTAWNTIANWKTVSASGAAATRLPTSEDSVVISRGTGSEPTLSADVTVASLTINSGATLTATGYTITGTIYGGGTIVYDGSIPATAPSLDPSWTGTVWLRNYTSLTGTSTQSGKTYGSTSFEPNDYGNINSTVKFTGVKGYFTAHNAESYTIQPALELEDDGATPGLLLYNGWGYNSSAKCYTIVSELKGSGTLKADPTIVNGSIPGLNVLLQVCKWDNFTGTLNMPNKNVAFGSTRPEQGDVEGGGHIVVQSGASVEVPAGKTWTVGSGVVVYGNLSLGTGASIARTTAGNTWIKQGTGTVTLNTLADLPATPADTWEGTVVLPPIGSINNTFDFNTYGNGGSTVKVTTIGGGYLKNVEILPNVEIETSLTLTDFSASFTNTFDKISGSGELNLSCPAGSVNNSGWESSYSAYFLVKDASDFAGSMNVSNVGVVIGGTTKPGKDVAGGKIRIASGTSATIPAGATWQAASGFHVDGALTCNKGGIMYGTGSAGTLALGGSGVITNKFEGGSAQCFNAGTITVSDSLEVVLVGGWSSFGSWTLNGTASLGYNPGSDTELGIGGEIASAGKNTTINVYGNGSNDVYLWQANGAKNAAIHIHDGGVLKVGDPNQSGMFAAGDAGNITIDNGGVLFLRSSESNHRSTTVNDGGTFKLGASAQATMSTLNLTNGSILEFGAGNATQISAEEIPSFTLGTAIISFSGGVTPTSGTKLIGFSNSMLQARRFALGGSFAATHVLTKENSGFVIRTGYGSVTTTSGTTPYATLDEIKYSASIAGEELEYITILTSDDVALSAFIPSIPIKNVGGGTITIDVTTEFSVAEKTVGDVTTYTVSNNPTTYTWTDAFLNQDESNNHEWIKTGNWEFGASQRATRYPGAGDTVIIDGSSTPRTLILDGSTTVAAMTVSGAVTFTASSGVGLNVSSGEIDLPTKATSITVNKVTLNPEMPTTSVVGAKVILDGNTYKVVYGTIFSVY